MSIARPEDSRDALLYKDPTYPVPFGSDLAVAPDECVVVASDGRMLGVIGPGRHRLVPQAFPFLSAATTGGPIGAELWFVRTTPLPGNRFAGQLGPLCDPASSLECDLRVFGDYALAVADPMALVTQCLVSGPDAVVQWTSSLVLGKLKAAAATIAETHGVMKVSTQLPMSVSGPFPELEGTGLRFERFGELTVSMSDESRAALLAWSTQRAQEKLAERARQQSAQAQPAAAPPAAAPPYAPPPGMLAVGGRVLVQWSDGNRYPGVVRHLAPGQVLVAFPNGEQWIPAQFVALG